MTEQEKVQLVTQADRDAGAEFWTFLGQQGSAEQCRNGTGFRDTAQAFARHRHTATAEALEAMRDAREALVNIRSTVQIHSSGYALDVYKCANAAIARIDGEQP
jgi:hypothetical protein